MKKLIVFDMDGTLADTSPGILNSHRHAHKMMGRPVPDDKALEGVIGGPLLKQFTDRFGYSEPDAREAVTIYRNYYAEKGLLEAELYPGMAEALRQLHNSGCKLGVATLKAERFVKVMLEHMGVADCFDAIYGMDEADTRTKTMLIDMCMEATGCSREETVMVGDSIHDLNGARLSGVDFLGVTYGFGFKDSIPEGEVFIDHASALPKAILSFGA